MDKNRVVIIGGGVVGLCAAYYCLKEGMAVTVLEREGPEESNCSVGNAGMVVPSHFIPLAAPGMMAKGLRWMFDRESPFYVKPRVSLDLARWGWLFYRNSTAAHVARVRELLRDLNLESRRLFTELAGEFDFGLETRGLLMLCDTAKGLDGEAKVAEEAAEIGVKARVLSPTEAAQADPGVTMNLAGAVLWEQDCHLDPARFLAGIRRKVLAMGGEVEHGVAVTEWVREGGKVRAVKAGGREFRGGSFVVAGGSWSAALLRDLGLKLPLQAGKGYSLTLPEPPELPQLCSIFAEAKVAITPMGRSLRFAGTMEVGGLDRSVDPLRVRGIIKSVPRYFPKFSERDFEGIEPWAGLRPVSPDGVPYLGPVPKVDNVVAATGHAMMGLSLGPVSGRLVADLLGAHQPFRGIGGMAVGRFS
ncbi:MAG: FAD-dependent oxidoreductase [Akkermansiaceae bacterium]|jgi:D-amino-acid dehydrogenase|nr:FAD-dependent oxidoreductase [Akkermansiaceae bacterium]